MRDSEEQFQELIANLSARLTKALSKSNKVPSIGLLLSLKGDVEPVLAVAENEELKEEVNLLQARLVSKAKESDSIAACLAYPDYEREEIVAYLENNENYCLKARIPIVTGPQLKLDILNIEVEDGIVFVFGAGDS
jgi:hypothetical protein